jgi:hypothetical protein
VAVPVVAPAPAVPEPAVCANAPAATSRPAAIPLIVVLKNLMQAGCAPRTAKACLRGRSPGYFFRSGGT